MTLSLQQEIEQPAVTSKEGDRDGASKFPATHQILPRCSTGGRTRGELREREKDRLIDRERVRETKKDKRYKERETDRQGKRDR